MVHQPTHRPPAFIDTQPAECLSSSSTCAMPVHIILLAAVSTDMKSRFACSRNGLPTRLPGWHAMSQHVTWCSRYLTAIARCGPCGLLSVRWSRDLTDVIGKAEFYPDVEERTLFRDGYIASRSSHSRGSTVDLTLVHEDGRDQQGLELDMGTPFDFRSKRSWVAAPSISLQARASPRLAAEAMRRHGFRPYAKESAGFPTLLRSGVSSK